MSTAILLKRTLAVSSAAVALATCGWAEESCPSVFMVNSGAVELRLDRAELLNHGLSAPSGSAMAAGVWGGRLVQSQSMPVDATSLFGFAVADGQIARVLGGELRLSSGLSLNSSAGPIEAAGLTLMYNPYGVERPITINDSITGEVIFDVSGALFTLEDAGVSLENAYVALSEEFIARSGASAAASPVVGELSMKASLAEVDASVLDFVAMSPIPAEVPDVGQRGFPNPGPDVIVGDIPNISQYGRVGTVGSGTIGAAIGTTSCNKGDTILNWRQMPDVRHPVIAQNVYRLMTVNGASRFEHIGQSWVKHGFCALQLQLCFNCTPAGSGCLNRLGVGCADPYDSGLNATQSNLGARSWINPYTGVFTSAARSHTGHSHNAIDHRIQIRDVDLAIPGAIYYDEGQYVAQDDATAGNQFNNVSHRRINVSGPSGGGTFTFTNNGGVVRESPAIDKWTTATKQTLLPLVDDGMAILGYEVTDLGNGTWHYEIALYNMNFNTAFNSFSVPIPDGVTVSNVGFHYPLNHGPQATGGEFDNIDWAVSTSGGALTWSCENEATNPNANALRWASLFNFRFDADSPPETATATIGLYKTGGTTTAEIQAPSAVPCPADLDGDGQVDLTDLSIQLANFGGPGTPAQGDLDGDGQVDLTDLSILLSQFGLGC